MDRELFEYLNNEIDIDYLAQIHRANEKQMAYVLPSLRRIAAEAAKIQHVSLTGIKFIRKFDHLSHSSKVWERKNNNKYFVSLMLGNDLYFEEYIPCCFCSNTYYAIEGLWTGVIVLPGDGLNEIFSCIPYSDYDLAEGRCRISKEAFLAGFRSYAKKKKSKGKKKL